MEEFSAEYYTRYKSSALGLAGTGRASSQVCASSPVNFANHG